MKHALRCLAEGDQIALRNMNFGPREIQALREMTLADLYRVESLRAHCIRIALNREVYWPMVDHLRSGTDDCQGQNLNTVDPKVQNLHPQNLKAGCCSSSYLYKTTTTTPTTQEEKRHKFGIAGENNAPLIYPKRLCDNQRGLADRYLATVSAQSRQAILDELEGRFRAGKKGCRRFMTR